MTIGFFETRLERKRPKRFADGRSRSVKHIEVNYDALRERSCNGCPLLTNDLQSPKMKPTGDKHPDVYVLGEAPGETEDKDGRQFVGISGKLLRRILAEVGIESVRFDNCVRCRTLANRTPERTEWERCRNKVIRSIERAQPKVLLAVGGTALQWATGESTITKWRGKLIPRMIGSYPCWVYPILHPSFVVRSANYAEEDWGLVFKHDLRGLASRLAAGLPDPAPELLESLESGIRYARDATGLAKLARQLEKWAGEKAIVAFDIETACLRPYQCLPPSSGWLSIAFSDGSIIWAVPISHREAGWTPDNMVQVKQLVRRFLRSKCVKVAHNLPFDLEWLTLIYGHKPRWKRTGWGDTMSQAYVLDERRGCLSLDDCCLHRFGFNLKSQSNVDRSKLAELEIGRLLKYNALDAKYTAKLYYIQQEEIEREGLIEPYRMHLRRCLTLVKAQQKGLVVDFDLVAKFQRKLEKRIARCTAEIVTSAEAKRYEKKIGKSLSPTSNPQLVVLFRDVLHRTEGQRKKNKTGYSVDDVALGAMVLPIADAILRMRTLAKQKSTYVDPCVSVGGLVYADGRLHTKFNDLFTVTGRLSSEDPNMQNYPMREDPWIRAIITTPKVHSITGDSCEHVMVSVDYGQIEPRVIAMESKDRALVKSFKDRHDIHLDWAERIAKVDPQVYRDYGKDIKKLRQDVKSNWVLAGFYGATYDAIAARLGLSGKCESLFDEFKEAFPGVWVWQEEQVRLYKENGYVTALTGRRRRAPLTLNQLLNNPTQGIASDIVVDAMNRLSVRAEKEEEPTYQAVLNIHDDLTFYVPKDRQEELITEIVREMLMPAFDWINVPMSVSVKVGPNWADMIPSGIYFSDELP